MKTYEIMLELIKSEICKTKLDNAVTEQISYDLLSDLLKISKKHNLAHIVASALDRAGLLKEDDASCQKFDFLMYQAAIRHEKLKHELRRIVSLFEEEKIEHIILKGPVIADYYPAPWMRNSCDIDILVRNSDIEKAVESLISKLDYKDKIIGAHDVTVTSSSGVHIELHHTLMEDGFYPSISDILEEAWKDSENKEGFTYQKKLSRPMFMFYHIAHMARHFLEGGCGVRPFIDLWVLENYAEYDFNECNDLLCKAGISVFAQKCKQLALVWFSGMEADSTIELMQKYVLEGGIYGTLENKVTLQKSKSGNGAKYALSRIFMPYNFLKHQYPIIKKYKFLTPYYQVCRWFKLIFKGGLSFSVNELSYNASLPQEEYENISKLLSELDL